MSLAASNWAWQQTCVAARTSESEALSSSPVNQKMVLLFLADLADHHGECSPGLRIICASTGMEKKTARKAIQRLLDQGLLSSRDRRDGTQNQLQTPVYRLPVAAPSTPTELPNQDVVVSFRPYETNGGCQVYPEGGCNVDTPPTQAQLCPSPPANYSPKVANFAPNSGNSCQSEQPLVVSSSTYKDSFLEETPLSTKDSPCTKQTTRETPRARKRAQPPSSGKPSAKVSDAVAIWNELVGSKLHLVLASRLSDKRVRRLDDILSSPDFANPDAWRRFCADIARSGFLCGDNERGWHANFDWVLKQDNLIKILEGGYRPIAKPPPVVARQNGWNPSGMTGYI